ncbi:MAG: 1-phosphofructokinase family hexose kinase [Fimbriimonadaceae bacterium]
MILTVTVNASLDQALFVDRLKLHDTNRVFRKEVDAGGKGVNLSRVAVELGGESTATGFLGGGPGAFVRKVLDKQGVHHDFVEVEGDTRINFSVEDGNGPPTTFNQPGPDVPAEKWEELKNKLREYGSKADWICLGGSLTRGIPKDAYRILGELTHEFNAKLCLDADGENFEQGVQACPELIKPNESEAERILSRPVKTTPQAIQASRDLEHRLKSLGAQAPYVIVSRGAKGAVLCHAGEVLLAEPVEVDVNSTIGSGDSMVAGFLVGLKQTNRLDEALRWGVAAGAATATTNGSEIARRPVFEELLERAKVREAPA